jgi:hypothetical protein
MEIYTTLPSAEKLPEEWQNKLLQIAGRLIPGLSPYVQQGWWRNKKDLLSLGWITPCLLAEIARVEISKSVLLRRRIETTVPERFGCFSFPDRTPVPGRNHYVVTLMGTRGAGKSTYSGLLEGALQARGEAKDITLCKMEDPFYVSRKILYHYETLSDLLNELGSLDAPSVMTLQARVANRPIIKSDWDYRHDLDVFLCLHILNVIYYFECLFASQYMAASTDKRVLFLANRGYPDMLLVIMARVLALRDAGLLPEDYMMIDPLLWQLECGISELEQCLANSNALFLLLHIDPVVSFARRPEEKGLTVEEVRMRRSFVEYQNSALIALMYYLQGIDPQNQWYLMYGDEWEERMLDNILDPVVHLLRGDPV